MCGNGCQNILYFLYLEHEILPDRPVEWERRQTNQMTRDRGTQAYTTTTSPSSIIGPMFTTKYPSYIIGIYSQILDHAKKE